MNIVGVAEHRAIREQTVEAAGVLGTIPRQVVETKLVHDDRNHQLRLAGSGRKQVRGGQSEQNCVFHFG